MSASFTRTDTHRGIRVIWVENPPVNALSPGVPEALMEAIDEASADPDVNGVVVIGGGRTFIAGADIGTLEPLAWDPDAPKPDLHDLLARVEGSAKPIVMAIHGTALGGGLELAMAAQYRVAVSSAKVGLPECALGIIPGAEGTQRLPRLAGVAKALDMVVTSKPVPAIEAHEHGILDAVLDGDLLTGAVAFAERAAAAGGPAPEDECAHRQARHAGRQRAAVRGRTCARAQDQAAPAGAVEGHRRDRDRATRCPSLKGARPRPGSFSRRFAPSRPRPCMHVFFAERAAAKIPGLPADVGATPVRRVGIVGAGHHGRRHRDGLHERGSRGPPAGCVEDGLDRGIADDPTQLRGLGRAEAVHRRGRSANACPASRRNSILRDSRPSTS